MTLSNNSDVDLLLATLNANLKDKIAKGKKIEVQIIVPVYEHKPLQWDAETNVQIMSELIHPGQIIINI